MIFSLAAELAADSRPHEVGEGQGGGTCSRALALGVCSIRLVMKAPSFILPRFAGEGMTSAFTRLREARFGGRRKVGVHRRLESFFVIGCGQRLRCDAPDQRF